MKEKNLKQNEAMDFFQLVIKRRSIRKFSSKQIPDFS